MIKIAFCDDSSEIINRLDNLMLMMEFQSELDWSMFYSGKELLDYLQKNDEAFNIYVLDIEMPGLNGIDAASKIREMDKNAVIIFLTDYKEYVYQVFEVLPFRFLQKPVELGILERTLNDAMNYIQQTKTLFFFQIGHEQMQRPIGEIICFEGMGRKIVIHTLAEQLSFYGKLNEIWERVDQQIFTRPHASFLVSMEFIRSVKQDRIIVQNNKVIPISKRFRSEFKHDYMSFVERRNGIV